MATDHNSSGTSIYQIRYPSLIQDGFGMTFPCDSNGSVNLDELPDRVWLNYYFARAMVGREFDGPVVYRS
jgi:hypothetical protein